LDGDHHWDAFWRVVSEPRINSCFGIKRWQKLEDLHLFSCRKDMQTLTGEVCVLSLVYLESVHWLHNQYSLILIKWIKLTNRSVNYHYNEEERVELEHIVHESVGTC